MLCCPTNNCEVSVVSAYICALIPRPYPTICFALSRCEVYGWPDPFNGPPLCYISADGFIPNALDHTITLFVAEAAYHPSDAVGYMVKDVATSAPTRETTMAQLEY